MSLFGKDERQRLNDTFAYIRGLKVGEPLVALLEEYVYANSVWEAASISEALSLGARPLLKTSDTNQRHAVRACVLARLAVDQPPSLDSAKGWKSALEKQSQAELDADIKRLLQRLSPPKPLPFVAPSHEIQAAYKKLTSVPKPQAQAKPVAPPPPSQTFEQKKAAFEKESRRHVILSGHGSLQPRNGQWPQVALKKNQRICFYVPDYWPLSNDVGKLVDNRRFPKPSEEVAGPARVWDYLLHHKDKLVLLNHPIGDALFINVQVDTPLSTFINDPDYATVTFHWAACRVCMANGKVLNPITNTFELYDQTHTPYVLSHNPPV